MGRPKLLNMLSPGPVDKILYTKAPSIVNTAVSETEIVVQDSIKEIQNGANILFNAPCKSDSVTHIRIGGVLYDLLDALGKTPVAAFEEGSLVSIILDTVNLYAFIQNAAAAAPVEAEAANVLATVVEIV